MKQEMTFSGWSETVRTGSNSSVWKQQKVGQACDGGKIWICWNKIPAWEESEIKKKTKELKFHAKYVTYFPELS